MSTSFGQWHQQQQGGGDGSDSILPLFGGSVSSLTTSFDSLNVDMSQMPAMDFGSIKSAMEAQMPAKVMGMNYQQRFKVFCVLLLLSALFFALAFFVGLPMITMRPQKFAISFTFGSLMFMGSFGILKGPMEHLKGMCQPDRMYFTVIYFGSMFATLYLTFNYGGVRGYALVMAASGAQLLALLWYLISFIPGGSAGLKLLLASLGQILKPVFVACAKAQAFCIAKCFSWMVTSRS